MRRVRGEETRRDCSFRFRDDHVCASVSKGNRSFLDFHTGDRCSFGRCCCITAVAPLLLHRFALFCSKQLCSVPCVRSTLHTSFRDAPSRFAKGVKVACFLFRRSNLRPSESRQPFCNFGTGLCVIDCMFPRCFAAVMATIMQRFLLWRALSKWRQQGHPRIWDDVSQVAQLCKQSSIRT